MSDYMFMLESHLTGAQYRVVDQMQSVASNLGVSLYLAGGAMRDVLGGFPVRELDFVTEASPLKVTRELQKQFGATVKAGGRGPIAEIEQKRKAAMVTFPNGVTVELAMTVSVTYAKTGAKPKVTPATIHEDMESRDFTLNAIALSLNPASLGLLIDPTNGVGDVERRELRTVHNYSFYDEPVRLLRVRRFKGRTGFAIEERTTMQWNNAVEAEMLKKISAGALGAELRAMACEANAHDVVQAVEEAGLWPLYSDALSGPKLNLPGFAKLQKTYALAPIDCDFRSDLLPLFLFVLFEKLTPKEKADVIKSARLTRTESGATQKMVAAAKKLERTLKGAKLSKASAVYQTLQGAPGEQVLYLALQSGQRIVQDRIKKYFQKYLPTAAEITDDMVAESPEGQGLKLHSPKFKKVKEESDPDAAGRATEEGRAGAAASATGDGSGSGVAKGAGVVGSCRGGHCQ